MTRKIYPFLLAGIFLAGLGLRVARLDIRPMHHDEANQALKFGTLLEEGRYSYDPADHHGPALYYLTMPAAWLAGAKTTAGLNETMLRLVPAVFGAALVLIFALMAGGMPREAIIFAALSTALSPFMTFYSRFYIQETLLIFFAALMIAAGWRYAKSPSAGWAVAAGAAAGAAFSCKETSLIIFAATTAALITVAMWEKRAGRALRPPGGPVRTAVHAGAAVLAAAAVAWLFFSSFGSNPGGPLDSFKGLGIYLQRGGSGGGHSEPFWYYFRMLAAGGRGPGGPWSEAIILALALAGAVAAFGRDTGKDGDRVFSRFILVFTAVTALVFSVIPYKTPWNAMPFYLGVLLMAGNGAGLLWRVSRFRIVRIMAVAVLIPGFADLAWQDCRANFTEHSDPANPYVYAQTSPDFMKLVRRAEEVKAAFGGEPLVVVAAPSDETWPLPWYLRRFGRVGYWTSWDKVPAEARRADMVIASSEEGTARTGGSEDDYVSSYFELRPDVLLSLSVKPDLWRKTLERNRKGTDRHAR